MEPMPPAEERDLLLRLRDGDRQAFETIYHRYKRRLAGNLLRLLKSHDLVDDALQELFAKLWEHRAAVAVDQPVKAYLFGIARNLTIDTFRRAAREEKFRNLLTAAFEEAYQHVEERLMPDERLALLEEAIALFPPQRQRVFRLCKLEGKSYEEVSELLHISTATVNAHITKGNQQLQEFFAARQHLAGALLAFSVLNGIA